MEQGELRGRQTVLPGTVGRRVPRELRRVFTVDPELETVEAEDALDWELAEPRRRLKHNNVKVL